MRHGSDDLTRCSDGPLLAAPVCVDRGVIATARELFEARHYPSVIAVCGDALDEEPDCLPLLLLRARAHIALRRDLDAQADLRDVIRLDGECSLAFRLLGELAARRDENESAAVFFREALRLDPGDRSAHDWLQIVDAAAPKRATRDEPPRFARGTQPLDPADVRGEPRTAARIARPPEPRPARPPSVPAQESWIMCADPRTEASIERPTKPFGHDAERAARRPVPRPPAPTPSSSVETTTLAGRPPLQPPARPARTARTSTPELPGFGEYLVASGILTRERLRAAQAYQRSMKVQLSTAVVTLGLATPQRIAWATAAHHSQIARDRPQ